VGGVREQRERVGGDREHDLGGHEGDDQRERDRERPDLGVGVPAVRVVLMAHGYKSYATGGLRD